MATVMEKDILLETVASALAFIVRKNLPERVPERVELSRIRNYIYATHNDNISYEDVLTQIDALKSKFEDIK